MTPYDRIEKVILYVAARREKPPRVSDLAKVAGLSQFHFHRLFSRWAGLTPKSFLKFVTSVRAKRLLRDSRGVLAASLEAGLSGPGRLHDLLVTVEGVTPGEYKAKGAGVAVRYGFHPTVFGEALAGVTARGICFLAFTGSGGRAAALADLRRKWPRAALREDARGTRPAVRRLFAGGKKRKVPVVLSGTPFQIKVWEALLRIPAGKVATYAQVAAAAGRPRAVRAAGTAVGQNPVAYAIPCHRVLRGTGALGGYRWGTARKCAMLAREGAARD